MNAADGAPWVDMLDCARRTPVTVAAVTAWSIRRV
jgi:hypothetical protein